MRKNYRKVVKILLEEYYANAHRHTQSICSLDELPSLLSDPPNSLTASPQAWNCKFVHLGDHRFISGVELSYSSILFYPLNDPFNCLPSHSFSSLFLQLWGSHRWSRRLWNQSLYSKITNPTMCESVFWFMPHNMFLCVSVFLPCVSLPPLSVDVLQPLSVTLMCSHLPCSYISHWKNRLTWQTEWCVPLQLLAFQVQSRLSRSPK